MTKRTEHLALVDRIERSTDFQEQVRTVRAALQACDCGKEDLCYSNMVLALLVGTATPDQQRTYAVTELSRVQAEMDASRRALETLSLFLAPAGKGNA